MKKVFLLIFAFITLMGLMSFTVDRGQKVERQTDEFITTFFAVETPPVVLTPPPAEIIVHEGDNLSLVVIFSSKPQANAVLRRETDEAIIGVERDYSLWVTESKVTITIPDIKVSDEGDYLVEIVNNRGNVFAAFTLVVIPKRI